MAKVITRSDGRQVLLFDGRTLARILRFTNLNPDWVDVEGFDSEKHSVFMATLRRNRAVRIEPQTQLVFYRLTRGRTPHAKLGFDAPRSVIILCEEDCRSHALPPNYVVRPY